MPGPIGTVDHTLISYVACRDQTELTMSLSSIGTTLSKATNSFTAAWTFCLASSPSTCSGISKLVLRTCTIACCPDIVPKR
jgi:hypothetical protein